MIDALSTAKYLIYLSYGENQYSLTHLKLQKLLYFAQGWSYVWDNKPLFAEDFIAWQYGPVCQEVYRRYKRYGSSELPKIEGIYGLEEKVSQDTVTAVWENYGRYTARELVEMTHQHTIWQKAYLSHSIISKQNIKEYFQSVFGDNNCLYEF